ncbi:hypothetical protein EFT49_10585 [Leuconostoc falkenbergense]|uniref:hypothetical protein n=1 Tax=Leuconostoc falkenbergense TaxID=2766470 RepID=UPI0021AA3DB4|nr:hypothetical protein [Leuconostoc falkenbergense]MCT4420611.1 hypothetical protein [Leuconostoc falkenbergense]
MTRYRIFSEPGILKESGSFASVVITASFPDVKDVLEYISVNHGWYVGNDVAFKPTYIEKVDD